MTPLNHKLIRDLIHMRGQMVAIALVVGCGVASYVSMRSTYQSLVISQANYYSSYRFADVFANLKRAPDSLAKQIADIPGVASTQTRVVVNVTLDVPGLDEPAVGRLVSIPERQAPMLNDLFIKQGRYVAAGSSDEVIVSEAFAAADHLNVGDHVSAVLNGRWKELRIVGIALSPEYIYEVNSGQIFPDNKRFGVLWMNREALGSAFNMEGAFNDVALALSRGANKQNVISRLDLLLATYGGLGAYDREDQISHRFISDEISQNRITGNVFPAIFLGIAAFLIYIVMSRLVSTQREQIGLLKAFGYGSSSVGLHYLKLSLAPVLGGIGLGTGVGIYFGYQLTQLYAEFYRFPRLSYELSPELIGTTILVSIAAASLGALWAVRRAISLPPAEAMRPEPPPRFRAGLLENLGLHWLFPPAARIMLRNLERRPGKAMLSSLGIALAVAMLVVGLYFFDAIDHIIRVQFGEVQREDLTVVFNEPRPARTRYELEHLPGVLRSEPFRSVPVRLRFEHHSRRTALLGLTPPSDLRRMVDMELNSFSVPTQGVVLTTKLAKILGLHPGNTVVVEVLEGARPVREVVVSGVVDELIGINAYMNIQTLNELMREGGTISGAYFSVDPLFTQQLYGLLKRTPAVSGVSIKASALASFNEIIAQSLSIFTAVLVAFACVIALGIVYNGARIALSERGRELASLRVLGFNQTEIGVMLLGEQAILTLVAVPLGFAIGYGICALIPFWLSSELYRLPLVVSAKTFAFSFAVVVAAAIFSGLLVSWRLRRLDLIAVLKTRE